MATWLVARGNKSCQDSWHFKKGTVFLEKRFIRRDRLAAFPFEHPFLLKVKKYGLTSDWQGMTIWWVEISEYGGV